MRDFTKVISCAFAMILFASVAAFGQIPPEQEVVVIENTENGIIEGTINADTLAGGIRANPQRIYKLVGGGAPYVITSPIQFGGGNDTTSVLTIIGEDSDGGIKPLIWTTPKDGGDAFSHTIVGSLDIQNVYWPTLTTSGKAGVLFRLQGTNQRLELTDFIHENQMSGDVISLNGVNGTMDIFLKNCYFRDMTQFSNPWNYAIFTRGDHKAIDTLWVENVTVANGGLLFMNKYTVVNFAFFDHNTIQNIPRYWNFMEQWKEAYFTNNVFINCLWMGEMDETKLTQLQSQTEHGPAHPETHGVEVGIINLMRPESSSVDWELGFGSAPSVDDVKFMASNNLTFTSPFLDNYYEGGLNDIADHPISYTNWDAATGQGWDGPPHDVTNIPARMFGPSLDSLIEMYDGVKAMDNHDQVDPMMNTKMIESQEEGDLYGTWARANFSWEGVTVPERASFTIGDYDPLTIPGNNSEESMGMNSVRDMPEDFSYTSDVVSTIDGLKLGAQEWYGDISDWDSEEQLRLAKAAYDGTTSIDENVVGGDAAVKVYPNPTNGVLNISSEFELNNVKFYDVTGRMVRQFELNGDFTRAIDVSDLNNGVYILQVKMLDGGSASSKFVKK